jgi:predicted ATP-dependent serine protease
MEKIDIDSLKRFTVDVLGFKLEGVSLVFGETGSGKTAFALKVVEKFLKEGKKITYISTEKKWEDINRIEKLMGKYGKEKFNVYVTSSSQEIEELINKINSDLIVIDNLNIAYKEESTKKMLDLCKLLKEKTFNENSLALITVHVYKDARVISLGSLVPIGGLKLYTLSNKRILIKKTHSWNKRILSTENGEKVIEIEEGFIKGDNNVSGS